MFEINFFLKIQFGKVRLQIFLQTEFVNLSLT